VNDVPPQSGQRSWEAEMFRLLVENVRDYAIFVTDVGGRVQSWSHGAQRLLGYEENEIVGQSADRLFTPEDVASAEPRKELRRAQETGRSEDNRWHIRKDGCRFWCAGVVTPLYDEQDRLRGFAKIMRDRTDWKRAEQARDEALAQLRLVTDHAPAFLAYCDRQYRFQFTNRGNAERFGRTPEELVGKPVADILGSEAFAAIRPYVDRVLAGEEIEFELEIPYQRLGRRFMHCAYAPQRGLSGEVEGWVAVIFDVSERKRLEQSLRFLADASASLATLVDYQSTLQKVAGLAVPHFADWCAVDMVSGSGTLERLAVVHVDPAKIQLARELESRYPDPPDSPYGITKVARSGQSDMMEDIPDALIEQGARDADHLRLLRALGFKSYMCVPLRGRDRVLGVVTFVSAESGRHYTADDLAFAEELARRAAIAIENARLYAELREADRRKDEFLAMLAHELRNPLAPIRNALHVLKQPAADATMMRQVRDMAERQVQHMARLLDDLLDVSRISRGRIELRRERIDVAAILGRSVEAVRPLVEERRHELTVSLPGGKVEVDADPTRLEQILTNLLNNAAKYTDSGGHIWLSAAQVGGEVALRVRDTGVGIAPDALPHIFDLFVQAERRLDRSSQGGVGIGLTLVKRLVEMHGGRIEASSAGPGQGSEFVVRLPLARPQPPEGTPRPAGQEIAADLPPRRVLVVDDNQDAADSLAVLLRLAGQDVQVAYDGAAALSLARSFRPEVVFLDIGLPGMDGYEVARRLREHLDGQKTVLVAVTGYGQDEDRRRSRDAGFDFHMVKPAEPRTLWPFFAHPKLVR
jgi:PAS domain S-box-containing protein